MVVEPRTTRLLVEMETASGSGEFQLDERLRVEEVQEGCDGRIGAARLSVSLDDAGDAEEVRRRYHPERRLIIVTDAESAEGRVVLFDGYPPRQTWRWDGRIGREGEEYVFEAEHVVRRLGQAPESLVYGRRVRSGAVEDALLEDPGAHAGDSVLLTALSCVFNPDGVGNASAYDIHVIDAGRERSIPIFTWDGDPHAVRWTFAAALRYLIWFFLPNGLAVSGEPLLDATEADGGELGRSLARTPVSLVCEGTSLLEALRLWAAAAGLHFSAETASPRFALGASGRPRTGLRIWAAGDGAARELLLARGGRYPDGQPRYRRPAGDTSRLLEDNNTYRGELSWSAHAACDCAVVLGDVKRYEMTLPLCPGWIPRDGLDNVPPSGRAAAKAKALTPAAVQALGPRAASQEWYQRYHRQGSLFRADADVARLWVLNEDGFFLGDMYNRNPPFDDYRPFDFSLVADAAVLAPGGWMRRRRRLLPPLSRTWEGRPVGVCVEVSFNGGETWQQQGGGVRVLQDRIGIYFDCENPAEIAPDPLDPRIQNMWYALIDGTFRVRVTATIEGDERVTAVAGAPGAGRNGQVLLRPNAFQFATRQHTTNVLASDLKGAERDDVPAAQALADQVVSESGRRVAGTPVIPWIETGYRIGERIKEIRGRQVRLAMGEGEDAPAILARRYVLRDGAYETELTLG